PMKEVEDLRTRHAWEKILVAAAESRNLVRKHRADHDDVIVFGEHVVGPHVYGFGEQAAGEFAQRLGIQPTVHAEYVGILPIVIDNADVAVALGPSRVRQIEVI